MKMNDGNGITTRKIGGMTIWLENDKSEEFPDLNKSSKSTVKERTSA